MKQARNIDVVILVSLAYKINPHCDDILLAQELSNHQLIVNFVAWDDASYDFKQARLVIIRACWDYDERADSFFLRLEQIAKSSQLINDFKNISAYKNKYYLQRLKDKGIPIVPTEYATSFGELSLAVKRLASNKVILKPTISASGRNTHLVNSSNKKDMMKFAGLILENKKAVVLQSYINTVETVGEKSTVVIDGSVVFTIRKTPTAGNFLVHEHHGGAYKKAHITQNEQGFIDKIISTFDLLPTYMRIDYLQDKSGNPLLLEVELIEPNLYLSRSKFTLQALTAKIVEALNHGSAR